MLIASKYEEINSPHVEDFCYITHNTYSKEEVVKMEVDLLKSLKFKMGNPTIKTFLRRFTKWFLVSKVRVSRGLDNGFKDRLIEEDEQEDAKAAAANSSKKAVKYARKEDAILHALEIESTRQCKTHPDFSSRVEKQAREQDGVKESLTKLRSDEDTDDTIEELSISEGMSNSVQELSQFGVSFEEPNHIGVSKEQSVQGRPHRNPNDLEDDGAEGTNDTLIMKSIATLITILFFYLLVCCVWGWGASCQSVSY
ncbi:unnamed protein product [Ilex paraguariensis]|uniref:Cyclin N-terminal domain-containing protein n=1 Tax=Ilex paraguariensis TaxID=185542 RepID=A0ABC8TJ15_9AQUA